MNRRFKLFLFALFFAVTLQMRAEEQVFTNLNFALTPPDSWVTITNITKRPGMFLVAYVSPEGGRMLTLVIDSSRKPQGPLNDKFIEGFDQGVEQSGGGKRISGKFVEMGGVKAYERTANRVINGRQTSSVLYAMLTSERFYSIEGIALKNPADDEDLQKALASFRFLTPVHEPQEFQQSAAFRAGYIFGKYVIPIGVVAVALSFIVLVILKSRRSKPPPLPPMP